MAETGSIFDDFTTSSSTHIRIFATDGQPKTVEQYNAAVNEYDATEKQNGVGKGTITGPFTGLVVGSIKEQARSGFEAINQPIQNVAQSPWVTDTHGMIASKLTGQPYEPATGLMGKLGRLNSPGFGLSLAGESVNTPGKAAATIALAAVPGMSQLSGIIPTLARAGAGFAGHMVGDRLTGTAETEAEDRPILERASTQQLMTVAGVAVADGITGVITGVLGKSLTAKATKQVSDDITAAIKTKYPRLTYSGKAGQEAYFSTKDGLADVVRIGVKALKGDGDELAKEFVDDVLRVMPTPRGMEDPLMRKVWQKDNLIGFKKELNGLLGRYETEANKFLDNIGDDAIKAVQTGKLEELRDEITNTIGRKFREITRKDISDITAADEKAKYAMDALKLFSTMQKYTEAHKRFTMGAEVLEVLKQSGQGSGTDPIKLQKFIHDKMMSLPNSSLMHDVASAAVRGGQIGGRDISPSQMLRDNPFRMIKAIGSMLPAPTKFTGTVRGTTPFKTIEALSKGEIQRFYEREEK